MLFTRIVAGSLLTFGRDHSSLTSLSEITAGDEQKSQLGLFQSSQNYAPLPVLVAIGDRGFVGLSLRVRVCEITKCIANYNQTMIASSGGTIQ